MLSRVFREKSRKRVRIAPEVESVPDSNSLTPQRQEALILSLSPGCRKSRRGKQYNVAKV